MGFEDFISEWHNSNNFITAKTSGSTGEPKIIKLDKKFVEESALRTIKYFGLSSESLLYSCISPDFIGGKMMAVRAIMANCRLRWEEPSNTPLLKTMPGERISLLSVVPSQMLYLMKQKKRLPEIQNILIGGSAINQDLKELIIKSGLNSYESYGMTETASHIAIRPLRKECEWFVTLPGINVEADERGCLKINFPDGKIIETNDLAILKSGKEFKINGRTDDVIVTGGRKVNPIEVESKISEVMKSKYLIAGEKDIKWGEKIILLIEGENNEEEKEKIKEKLRNILAPHEIPKNIKYVNKLPQTAGGKYIRKPRIL